ncbi:ACT domain-containing protein [Alteromonas sp. ASW11-19]|uniref:ACT domain-containing protein n=1 Tax=Alteromonas salexigens TaxID=2982530 RepID=A0ABT2VRN6_9ALTE|nr:ACT domain-containing protein [Alteromonas salexigens]MCU7554579.1 ACT domain-containing protein [Alteromonas salexigens]
MSGEDALSTLLHNLMPVLDTPTYVFVTVDPTDMPDCRVDDIKGMFREREGTTLIVQQEYADKHQLSYEGTFRCITCEVHSSLEAVGMTAAMSAVLTHEGISANVVAAYYHDHIFVPAHRADDAVAALASLQVER